MASDDKLYEHAERLIAQRDTTAATRALESVVARQPGHLMARLRLSTLATSQGRYRDSLAQLLAIAAQHPTEAELLVLIAGMLHRLGETSVALDCLQQESLRTSSDRALLEEAAQVATQMDSIPLAEALLDRADAFSCPGVDGLYTRATAQLFQGRTARAEATLESCLSLDANFVQAHWALSRARRQDLASNHVSRLRGQLSTRAPDDPGVPFLAFALFKELDDLGETEAAWTALQAGSRAKRARLDYRERDEVAAFQALSGINRVDTNVGSLASAGDATPIFIVGLPRTGTTLLERILSAHPQVQDAGELDDFPLQMRWMANRFSKSFLDPAVFAAQSAGDAATLGRRYLEHAAWRANGKPYFTDKLPLNFLHVGLIARALPQARILHMVRNPMDTCFSNLKELFAAAYPHSYDQREMAAHYGRYRRLMDHWHASFPGRVHDVRYEELVSDPEPVARALMSFCGLPWQPDSLRIEAREGAVTTASSAQVREPIHQRGIDGWRRYEAQLQPLRAALQADGWLPG